MDSTERIKRLPAALATTAVAIAIARGPNSRAEAVSTQGVVRVESKQEER